MRVKNHCGMTFTGGNRSTSLSVTLAIHLNHVQVNHPLGGRVLFYRSDS